MYLLRRFHYRPVSSCSFKMNFLVLTFFFSVFRFKAWLLWAMFILRNVVISLAYRSNFNSFFNWLKSFGKAINTWIHQHKHEMRLTQPVKCFTTASFTECYHIDHDSWGTITASQGLKNNHEHFGDFFFEQMWISLIGVGFLATTHDGKVDFLF